MFEFITKMFRFRKKQHTVLMEVPPGGPIDPSKEKVSKDVGERPGITKDGMIERSEGHINFNNTKPITRSFKRGKLRKSLEERKTSFYNKDGKLYDE